MIPKAKSFRARNTYNWALSRGIGGMWKSFSFSLQKKKVQSTQSTKDTVHALLFLQNRNHIFIFQLMVQTNNLWLVLNRGTIH